MNATLESMREAMRERFGERAERRSPRSIKRRTKNWKKAEEPPDPGRSKPRSQLAEKRAKHARLLAKGKFPIRSRPISPTDPAQRSRVPLPAR